MKDRIRQIMESKHMTQQEFASYVGMSAAALSSIFNERTRPTLNTVEAIKSKMPEINTDWLMFGKGDMMVKPSTSDSSTASTEAQPLPLDMAAASPAQPVAVTGKTSTASPQVNNGISAIRVNGIGKSETAEKNIDKRQRRITEIRVFFDDQTFESFVPRKS